MYSAETKQRLVDSIPKPMFREITSEAELKFDHQPNPELHARRVELVIPLGLAGGGVSAADFDDDGWDDLYFGGDRGGALYRNVEGKRVQDITQEAGLGRTGETRSGYFVDYDNDGDLDLYITLVWESNRLYENSGDGKFVDVTEQVGLQSGQQVTHEAVWFDMDNDGLLDLYTATFGGWPEGAVPTLGRMNTNAGPNRLYHHRFDDGKHVFDEVGEQLGVDDRGWTHCVGAWDFDEDGYLDLFSLNDFGASLVYHNLAGKAFEEVSRDLHLDATYNAMNFTLLDLDHDGQLAMYITQIMKLSHRQRYRKPTEETKVVFTPRSIENLRAVVLNRLYSLGQDGMYDDVHDARFEPAELGWAWDASTLDYENDADLDLLVLNGSEDAVPSYPLTTYIAQHAQQNNVFYSSENGYFYDVSAFCPLAFTGNSRGSAFFDFDHDGDLDIAVSNYSSPAMLFENVQRANNHWIRFRLEGTESNRSAIGARVKIEFADQVRYDQVVSGSGFLSQNPLTIHFGLGSAETVDKLTVTWPSRIVQELDDLAVDQTHHIVEPEDDGI